MRLQVAIDIVDSKKALELAGIVAPLVDILEIGTPLLKAAGVSVIKEFRSCFPQKTVLADTKTMDVGGLEAQLAFDAGADIMTVCAAAPLETIASAIKEAHRRNKQVLVDFIGVAEPIQRAKEIVGLKPDYLGLHTAIDVQKLKGKSFENLKQFKEAFDIPVAVAGGITPDDLPLILPYEPEILIVGGFITNSANPLEAVQAIRRAMSHALS